VFEKMMTYKKAWAEFCEWIGKRYEYVQLYKDKKFYRNKEDVIYNEDDLSIWNDFILFVMPFFFDEFGIEVNTDIISCTVLYKRFNECIVAADREKALIKGCEKAFLILESQLETK
jgi:hypothetical protein